MLIYDVNKLMLYFNPLIIYVAHEELCILNLINWLIPYLSRICLDWDNILRSFQIICKKISLIMLVNLILVRSPLQATVIY
jgi:hypothetical protein